MRKLIKSELRIGNLVQSEANGGYKIHKVEWVSEYMIGFDNDAPFVPLRLIPIPITEDWLVKLGFRLVSGNGYELKCKDGCFLWLDETDKTFSFGQPYECSGNELKIEYVHQLQNLYFALTGEELTIKE